MDDKRIEDMLRNSWRPKPPDGMRDRILRQAEEDSAKWQTRWQISGMSRWRFALATFCIAIIAFANIAENTREDRIAMMMGDQSAFSAKLQVAQVISPQEFKWRQSHMIKKFIEMESVESL